MKYNFDEVIDRHGTESYKWDAGDFFFPECPEALPLWVADMDFPCPEPIVKAVQKRAAHPVYGYGYAGDDVKLPAIAWQKKRNNWDVKMESILLSNGVVPAIGQAIQALTKEGDGIIVQTPVYYPFMDTIEVNNRVVEENPLIFDGETWKMDLEGFEKLAGKESTKLFLLCNPHNPVGRVFTEEELRTVGEICLKHHVLIFSDEIHSDLIFKGSKHIPIASLSPELADITVTAFAPSKTFNVAGLQASIVVADNEEIREKLELEYTKDFFVLNLFGVVVLKAAYGECEDYLDQLMDYLWGNYEYLDAYLKEHMPKIKCQKPEGTYLMWLDCSELHMSSEELKELFLVKAKVAFDEGQWFQGVGKSFMRLNAACPRSTLEECLRRMKTAYDSLEQK